VPIIVDGHYRRARISALSPLTKLALGGLRRRDTIDENVALLTLDFLARIVSR